MLRPLALIAVLAFTTSAHAQNPLPQVNAIVPYSYGEIVTAFLKNFSCTNIEKHEKPQSPITLKASCNGRPATAYAEVIRIANNEKTLAEIVASMEGKKSLPCGEQKVERSATGITVTQICPLSYAQRKGDAPAPVQAQMQLTFTLTYQ